MAYADWIFYQEVFAGVAIDEPDFDRLATRSSEIIDRLTYGRAESETTDPNLTLIKKATCAVAETYQAIESMGDRDGVQAESAGRTSVTYAPGATRSLTKMQRYRQAAAIHLGGTGLMAGTFEAGEYSSGID